MIPPVLSPRSRALLACLLLTIAFAMRTAHAAPRLGFPVLETFSHAAIGTDAAVMRMAQDKDGILYFAAGGLLSFDAERWTVTPLRGSFRLHSLQWGDDGRLWVAASGEIGWFRLNAAGRWEFTSLREKLPPTEATIGEAWEIVPDRDGATFVTEDRILRWNGRDFVSWSMPGTRRLSAIRAGNETFVHYLKEGLYRLGPKGPQLMIPQEKFGEAGVMWMERRSAGWLLGTSRGFFLYDGTDLHPYAPEATEFIKRELLTCMTRLPDGRLFVGTLKGGGMFVRLDGQPDYILNESSGLPSSYVSCTFVDAEQNLWIGTATHIVRMSLIANSSLFDERAGVPARSINDITRWADRMVFANDKGPYELDLGNQTFSLIEPLRGQVNDIIGASNELLVVGYRGVKRWDGNNVSIVHPTATDSFALAQSRFDPRERFVVDNRSVLKFSSDGSSAIVAENLPAIPTSLAQDTTGRLWLGTYGRGLLAIRDESGAEAAVEAPAISFEAPRVEGHARVRSTDDGSIFVFGTNGAWLKAPATARFVSVADFPAGRKLAAVSSATPEGSVWVIFDRAGAQQPTVGRVFRRGTEAVWEPYHIDSLWAVDAPRAIYAERASGNETALWIGGTHGLLRHVVRRGLAAPVPRQPLLRSYTRRSTSSAKEPLTETLPYSTANIELEFAAPEYSRRRALRIETRIDGIDETWSSLGADSRRVLSGLREGNYLVRARVVSDTGARSEETTLAFRISPPWWRTAPAYLVFVLTLVPLGYTAYRLRLRALQRRNTELEEKVRLRTKELEAANAAKTEFVANMSHDIRNPLNGIVGLALALEDTRLDRRQREIVATLRECTGYLSTLVDDVLDFASIEAGRVELRPGPFVPGELLRSIITTLKADTAERGAMLTSEADPALPPRLLGDAGRIQQILVNFVSNALKYAGGHIHLSVRHPPGAPDEIEFAVADEGPGISLAEQATLFTKFTRLQRSRDADIPGAGLGLAACRLLADIMGGSVGVESEPGHGARFFLRLPLAVATTAPEPAPTNLPNSTVLLVEDTDYNALAASSVLARLGLSCDRAATGAEAVRMFSEKRYNVVLLDRNLPDMDGTEVARRIRNLESDGHQAILLAVTAYCTAEDRALCLEAGMDAFVGKPLTPEKLRRVLLAAGRRLLAAATVDVPPDAAPTPAPAAPVDLSLLTYLSDGTDQGLSHQIGRFLETLSAAESHLTAAVRDGDFDAVRTHAHRVLGQARMIGGGGLGDAALALEEAATSHDTDACRERLRHVGEEIRALKAAMRYRPQPMSTT